MPDQSMRVIFLGFGAVAQCTLPLLVKHCRISPSKITVIEMATSTPMAAEWIDRGVRFLTCKVTAQNMHDLLSQHVGKDDLVIDLAWHTGTSDLVEWCQKHGTHYVNTSIETWGATETPSSEMSDDLLYDRHVQMTELAARVDRKGPTAVLDHGTNPGLISHFTKQALVDIGNRAIEEKRIAGLQAEQVRDALTFERFAALAQWLGVRVIHCSELDTQSSRIPKKPTEFVNTWSIEGFCQEALAPAEFAWGTHESALPEGAFIPNCGPGGHIAINRLGMNVHVRSCVPGRHIQGAVIRHGETYTISQHLSVEKNGSVIYRPTVLYAYQPCPDASQSLTEVQSFRHHRHPESRVLNDDIVTGSDTIGALLMGHCFRSWWTGSVLSIEESRRLVPHQNATTVQVAISVIAAADWAIKNPERGVVFPEELPHDMILAIAKPYLGEFLSMPLDWGPLDAADVRSRSPRNAPSEWQFRNFELP